MCNVLHFHLYSILNPAYTFINLKLILPSLTAGVQVLIDRMRHHLCKTGVRGIINLGKKFRALDDAGNGAMTVVEFKRGIEKSKIPIDVAEIRQVFQFFDWDGTGAILYDGFMDALRGEIGEKRIEIIKAAFSVLDKEGTGIIAPHELMGRYRASEHPAVTEGSKTSEEIMVEFLETFEVGGIVEGKVTKEEFVNYYKCVSAATESDSYFELLLRKTWGIPAREAWAPDTEKR